MPSSLAYEPEKLHTVFSKYMRLLQPNCTEPSLLVILESLCKEFTEVLVTEGARSIKMSSFSIEAPPSVEDLESRRRLIDL